MALLGNVTCGVDGDGNNVEVEFEATKRVKFDREGILGQHVSDTVKSATPKKWELELARLISWDLFPVRRQRCWANIKHCAVIRD